MHKSVQVIKVYFYVESYASVYFLYVMVDFTAIVFTYIHIRLMASYGFWETEKHPSMKKAPI